jgi:hypothetical protein
VKTIQQHAHRAISAVHTVRQQRRHRSTVALCTLQRRPICHPKQRRRWRSPKIRPEKEKSEADKDGKQRKTDLKKLTKTDCLCVLFWLQVTVIFTAGEERKKDEAAPDPPAAWSFLQRRVNPRAASDGGAWEDALPLFIRVQKASRALFQKP